MCSQFTFHHKFRIDSGRAKILAGKDRLYSLWPWIPCMRIREIRKSLIWSDHVLHRTSKSGKRHQETVYMVDTQLAQRKGFKFYQTRSNALSSTIHSQIIVSRKWLWWNLKKLYRRRYASHFDHRKVQPKPKNQVRWDPCVDQNPLCVACWHLHMSKKIKQVREDP